MVQAENDIPLQVAEIVNIASPLSDEGFTITHQYAEELLQQKF